MKLTVVSRHTHPDTAATQLIVFTDGHDPFCILPDGVVGLVTPVYQAAGALQDALSLPAPADSPLPAKLLTFVRCLPDDTIAARITYALCRTADAESSILCMPYLANSEDVTWGIQGFLNSRGAITTMQSITILAYSDADALTIANALRAEGLTVAQ